MSNQNRPKAPFAKTETEAPSAPAAEATVEAVVEAVAEAPVPAPLKLGRELASLLKASVNDMHHYGVISDAEAVSLKERLDAKS